MLTAITYYLVTVPPDGSDDWTGYTVYDTYPAAEPNVPPGGKLYVVEHELEIDGGICSIPRGNGELLMWVGDCGEAREVQ